MEEKLYLECYTCGEVFDNMQSAKLHEDNDAEESPCEDPNYFIKIESEAF